MAEGESRAITGFVRGALIAVGLLLSCSAAAWSAEPSSDAGGLEEIVVTAQRHEQTINDVPIAVTAFNGEALKDLGVTDTRDLGNVIPGLYVSNAGFNKPVYTLRGVGFNETSQTASSTVGVYLDEINFPFDIMTKGANLDLERVEVLKGPQGTLYGRNTTGGAINYVSKKPTDDFESGITAGLGRFLTTDVEGFASGPIVSTLKARVAIRDIHSQEGWQISNTRPDDRLGKIDKQAGRLILDWLPIDRLPVTLTLQGWRDHSEPQAPQAIGVQAQNQQLGAAALDPSVRNYPLVPVHGADNQVADWPTDFPWQLKDRFLMSSLRTDWAITDTITLTLQGAYEDFLSDNSLLPQNGFDVLNVENRLYDETKAYIVEPRLAGNVLGSGKWQLGGYWSRDTVFEDLLFFVDTNSAVFPVNGMATIANRLKVLADQSANTRAAFGHVELPFLEAFRATLGLRYTDELRRYKGCSSDSDENTEGTGFAPVFTAIALAGPITNPGSPPPTVLPQPGGCFTIDPATNNAGFFHGKLDESNVSGRGAIDWRPTDDLLFYVSFSRGFKSGSFPAISASSQAQLDPVKQERLDAYETGGKLTLLDHALQANYALFYYDYKDKQLLNRVVDPLFGPLPILRNAPKSRVKGAELEIEASPIHGLLLSASGAFLDTKVIEFVGVDEAGQRKDFAGNEFNFTPRFSYALLARYAYPIRPGLEATVGADYDYKSRTNSVLGGDPLFAIPAYGLVNARIGVGSSEGAWTLSFWCRNLLDKFYTVSVFDPGDAVARYAGMPRTFGGSIAYTFH